MLHSLFNIDCDTSNDRIFSVFVEVDPIFGVLLLHFLREVWKCRISVVNSQCKSSVATALLRDLLCSFEQLNEQVVKGKQNSSMEI